MRDQSHLEQIDRWAEYVKTHPNEWKIKLKPFIDSQIIIAQRFYKNLNKTKKGQDILKRIVDSKVSSINGII